jgi:hypothetical protein
MNNIIKIRLNACILVFLCSFLLFSCSSPTIEEQVEELIETTDAGKRELMALNLADSLNPKTIALLKNQANKMYVTEALDNMLLRFSVLIKDKNSQEKVIHCVGAMQTIKSAIFIGEQSMLSDIKHIAFGYLKKLPTDLKKEAIISGLKIDSGAMQDSLIFEYYSLGHSDLEYILDNPANVSNSSLQKVISTNLSKSDFSEELKVKSIIAGIMEADDDKFKLYLLNLSKAYGNKPLSKLYEKWLQDKDSDKLLRAIDAYGSDALVYLGGKLGNDKNAEELLARIGKPAVGTLMGQMKSSDQKVRFAAADALVMMVRFNPDAVSNLTQAFDNGSLGAIANNYPFYIRLGQSGTEDLLLKALNAYFNRPMCLDYLNCGNQEIEEGSKKIAEARGYNIFSREGHHDGPQWGSGN